MYLLYFLRRKALRPVDSAAYIKKNGLRVNSDGTDIKDRKHHIQICPNHRHIQFMPGIVFNMGTAIRRGNKYYPMQPEDYGMKSNNHELNCLVPAKLNGCPKRHRGESLSSFRARRKVANQKRRKREAIS